MPHSYHLKYSKTRTNTYERNEQNLIIVYQSINQKASPVSFRALLPSRFLVRCKMQTPTLTTKLYTCACTRTYAQILFPLVFFGHCCLVCIKRRQEKENRTPQRRRKKRRTKKDRQTTHLSNHRMCVFFLLLFVFLSFSLLLKSWCRWIYICTMSKSSTLLSCSTPVCIDSETDIHI